MQEVRRIEGQEVGSSRGRHCPHGHRHDEVGDAKKAPAISRPQGAWRLLRQQPRYDDGKAASHDVANPCRQRKLPGQASVRPKHEEDATLDAKHLGRHDPV